MTNQTPPSPPSTPSSVRPEIRSVLLSGVAGLGVLTILAAVLLGPELADAAFGLITGAVLVALSPTNKWALSSFALSLIAGIIDGTTIQDGGAVNPGWLWAIFVLHAFAFGLAVKFVLTASSLVDDSARVFQGFVAIVWRMEFLIVIIVLALVILSIIVLSVATGASLGLITVL